MNGNACNNVQTDTDLNFDPDAWLYRERTIALLRRFLRISLEVGRLPSLLGRELFRSKVTSYRMSSFARRGTGAGPAKRILQTADRDNHFPGIHAGGSGPDTALCQKDGLPGVSGCA